MSKPFKRSKCFAVRSLRKVLKANNDPGAYPKGTKKDFVVEKHLRHFKKEENLRRNFSFWWRWTQPDGIVKPE